MFAPGVFRLWYSRAPRQSFLILEDYADAAVKVICEDSKHYGATYELSLSDCLTGYEIADTFAIVMGKPVATEELTPKNVFLNYRKHLAVKARRAAGQNVTVADFDYEFEVFRTIRECYGTQDFVGNPNVLTGLLGCTPTMVEEYLTTVYAGYCQAGQVR